MNLPVPAAPASSPVSPTPSAGHARRGQGPPFADVLERVESRAGIGPSAHVDRQPTPAAPEPEDEPAAAKVEPADETSVSLPGGLLPMIRQLVDQVRSTLAGHEGDGGEAGGPTIETVAQAGEVAGGSALVAVGAEPDAPPAVDGDAAAHAPPDLAVDPSAAPTPIPGGSGVAPTSSIEVSPTSGVSAPAGATTGEPATVDGAEAAAMDSAVVTPGELSVEDVDRTTTDLAVQVDRTSTDGAGTPSTVLERSTLGATEDAPVRATQPPSGPPLEGEAVEGMGLSRQADGPSDRLPPEQAASDVADVGPAGARVDAGLRLAPAGQRAQAHTAVIERIMRAVEMLENAPPPRRLSFEVDGLQMSVSLHGRDVLVDIRGEGQRPAHADLARALAGRGMNLATSDGRSDGQGARPGNDRSEGGPTRGPATGSSSTARPRDRARDHRSEGLRL